LENATQKLQNEHCFFCGQGCEVGHANSITLFRCVYCGKYGIDSLIFNERHPQYKELLCSAYYYQIQIVNPSQKTNAFTIEKSNYDDAETPLYNYVYKDTLEIIKPANFSDRVNKSLLNLSFLLPTPSDEILMVHGVSKPRIENLKHLRIAIFDTENIGNISEGSPQVFGSARAFLELVKEMGYLTSRTIHGHIEHTRYRISAQGWLKVQELQEKNEVAMQAFVAMWFDPSMKDAREAIRKAIQDDNGYLAHLADEKQHNNQIMADIFYEIKRSKFLVADLTGNRGGVYYEAGYAKALGKEVIFCCWNKTFENVHFDVRPENIILWANNEQLQADLARRIKVTMGNCEV
jgi:hypothetical protein